MPSSAINKSCDKVDGHIIISINDEKKSVYEYYVDEASGYLYKRPNSDDIIRLTQASNIKNNESTDTEGIPLISVLSTEEENKETEEFVVIEVMVDNKLESEANENGVVNNSNTTISIDCFNENLLDNEEKLDNKHTLDRNVISQTYNCDKCPYRNKKKCLLKRHSRIHSTKHPFSCKFCDATFKFIGPLNNHINIHYGYKPHKCEDCDKRFTTSGELTRHIRYIHTHEKPHKCTECNYAAVELSKLRRHIRSHTQERPFQCSDCTYAAVDAFKLKRHLRTHTGEKPYHCDVCGFNFTQSNSLKIHKKVHEPTSQTRYQCEVCSATCSRKSDLRFHIQSLHTFVKVTNCKFCYKGFSDRYSYKMHIKSHVGEKCYKCPSCTYSATTLSTLKSHFRIHTCETQKPFACNLCTKAFSQKQLLNRHFNYKHNPEFVPSSPLEKRYECIHCYCKFARKGNLIRHIKNHINC